MSEWYKEWFNTPEYLNVYRHRNDDDALSLAALIFDIVKPKAGSLVLDMACGAGRHSIIFAQKGMHVTAVDLSENLLSVAKENAEKLNLQINFINADLRHFHLEKKFNLALNLFTSFGYFEEDEENFKVFEQAYEHLNDDGIFVFDYFNSIYLKENLIAKSIDEYDGLQVTMNRRIVNDRVEKRIAIRKNGDVYTFLESVKMYSYDTIINAMKKFGFTIIKSCGDFAGNPFEESASSRVIIFAKK